MKPRIILTTPREELLIATFQNLNEAFICAALLQAKVNSEEFIYSVEFKEKGIQKRRQPDSLNIVLQTLATNQKEKLISI